MRAVLVDTVKNAGFFFKSDFPLCDFDFALIYVGYVVVTTTYFSPKTATTTYLYYHVFLAGRRPAKFEGFSAAGEFLKGYIPTLARKRDF